MKIGFNNEDGELIEFSPIWNEKKLMIHYSDFDNSSWFEIDGYEFDKLIELLEDLKNHKEGGENENK